MESFQAERFPLHGRRLIEASAGTGKTYNIANLTLRLLLGDGFAPLTIDNILVVTFTRAATDELRGRIRARIAEALQAFRAPDDYRAGNADAFILKMLERFHSDEERRAGCRWLNAALICMDEASIFTIHGFAVRVIQSFLFETGALAGVELSEAGSERRQQAMADLWRQLQLHNDATVNRYFAAAGFGSSKEFFSYFAAVPLECSVIPAMDASLWQQGLVAAIGAIDAELEGLRQRILAERASLVARWQAHFGHDDDDAIKKALKPVIDIPTRENPNPKTVTQYLLPVMKKWMASDSLELDVPGAATNARMDLLLASGKKDPLALLVIDWITHARAGIDEKAWRRNRLLPLLVQWLQARFAGVDLAALQLDEVIRLINHKLSAGNEAALALHRIITENYPVCLVDEFQDTDPQQFLLFNSLYADSDGTGFFMIGDPKQSIYAFRGADIFSYLTVRRQVRQAELASDDAKIFSLQTNFRSKQRLIAATNALFAEPAGQAGRPVFLYDGIDYQPVSSCEDAPFCHHKGQLQVTGPGLSASALHFIGNPYSEDPQARINYSRLRYHYASDAAQRIAGLLQGATLTDGSGRTKPLRAGDIAILVRNGDEARSMREALQRQVPPIGSVYQSQRDSVFTASPLARDIYHILRACHEPNNKSLLKSAIVTPLYRGFAPGFALLEALDGHAGSDDVLEQLIAEFTRYRDCWHQSGVLAALGLLLQRQGLIQALARQPGCDRLMTDFRHLGDLLQHQQFNVGSPEQLIDWYARQLKDDSAMDEDAKRIRLESDDNLVRIVTIHVSKGLEYPVVFLPFFFMPFRVHAGRRLPLLHNPANDYRAEINFEQPRQAVEEQLQQEQLAEDMRLLYVAITRAVHQCYIGISAATHGSDRKPMFPFTPWAHLLPVAGDALRPSWPELQAALLQRLAGVDVECHVLYDAASDKPSVRPDSRVEPVQLLAPVMPVLTRSPWLITSYSRLANARHELRTEGKDDETVDVTGQPLPEEERLWQDNIRFTLKGSANTGECLHAIYEELARHAHYYLGAQDSARHDPGSSGQGAVNGGWPVLVEKMLGRYGLLEAGGSREQIETRRRQVDDVAAWLDATLACALGTPARVPALKTLFRQGQVLPELRFDFALGNQGVASFADRINPVLHQAGLEGISLPFRTELQGIMNGAIDLVFVHDDRVYLLDYKSNTLGRQPSAYQQSAMAACMSASRYDLQYMIYSVALHRYCRHRCGAGYDYDNGTRLSFGGVFYLFVRGMGIPGAPPDTGIRFVRPLREHIEQFDRALAGTETTGEGL